MNVTTDLFGPLINNIKEECFEKCNVTEGQRETAEKMFELACKWSTEFWQIEGYFIDMFQTLAERMK